MHVRSFAENSADLGIKSIVTAQENIFCLYNQFTIVVETSFKNIIRGKISQPAGKRFLHKTEPDTFCALFDVVYLTFLIWIPPTSFWIQIDCFLQFYDQIPPSDHQQLFLQPCKLSVHQFFFLVVIFLFFAKVWSGPHQPRSGLQRLSNWFWRTPRKQTLNISLDKYSSLSNMVLTNSTKHKLQQLCTKYLLKKVHSRIGLEFVPPARIEKL